LQCQNKLEKAFSSPEGARKLVSLKAFKKFDTTQDALAAAAALVDSKLPKSLKKFLSKHADPEAGDSLALADAKLGGIVKDKLNLPCIFSTGVQELMRGLRQQLGTLVAGLGGAASGLAPMSLGLSHSLSRYKLKFSPDKVDTMVVQAIGLLDDLDKELNTYAMRVREWYGWHFPELVKVLNDNLLYAKAVRLMGMRTGAAATDFSEAGLDEQQEADLKHAAQVSMGTDISDSDMDHIRALADQVVALAEYRSQLYDYLKARMAAIAPNLTVLVGELVGARLIAHAGSLLALAKHPASTVQILGAEKALFRALKTKHDTPKYGLIYHASLVGASAPKLKGKISRVLAAKCALSIRVDALGDAAGATIGVEDREKVCVSPTALPGVRWPAVCASARPHCRAGVALLPWHGFGLGATSCRHAPSGALGRWPWPLPGALR
jgi:nucleolar protein 58